MANTKTSAETAASALDGTELVRIVQGGNSRRTTVLAMNKIAQVVNTQSGAVATGTTTIPSDDTIPQNTEGTEFLTRAITPTNAGSTLLIDVVLFVACDALVGIIAGLFQDTTANALAAASFRNPVAHGVYCLTFRHKMTAGTTSATTFKVRAGPASAGTVTVNGSNTARFFGGVMASSITVTEITP